MKGSEKPKKLAKKAPQKTLEKKRSDKRNKKKHGGLGTGQVGPRPANKRETPPSQL